MGLTINAFSLTLLLGGLVALFVSILIFQRIGGTVRWFAYLMLAISIWAITYGIELSSSSLDQMLFWVNFEYLGIALLPAFWIVFIIKFIGKDKWLTKLNLFFIFIIPALTLFFVFTKQWIHIHYAHTEIDTSGPFPLLSITPGIWYHIHTIYFYSMLALGIFLLLYKFRKADSVYKNQNRIIIIGAVIPWIVNFIYLLKLRPFKHIDLTPYSFVLAALVIGFGLLKFGLFDIIPIARDKVIDGIQDGIIVLDDQERIVDINLAMKKIIDNNTIKFIGSDFSSILLSQPKLHENVFNRSCEKLDVTLSGKTFEVTLTPLSEKNTVFGGVILIFRDITQRNEWEQKLKEQAVELTSLNKLKDKLFSIIAHDLRTPLFNLMETLNLINKGLITEKEFISILPILLKNAQYTSGLLENLLYWSKSQLQGETIVAESFVLNDILDNEIQLCEKRASEKDIPIINQIDDTVRVYADKTMISLVLRNLLSNALKFCREEDTITVSVYPDDKNTTVCVADTGIGIKKENIDRIFSYENFTTRGLKNEEGTGLGLILCKDFIEKNNGYIWVESEPLKGSKFFFTIPNASTV